MSTELLDCEACHLLWSRPVVRGRKPSICPTCKWLGYRPRPRPRTEQRSGAFGLCISDCGRTAAGFASENNDCTVRSIGHATNSGYAAAHAFMAHNGRRPRRGAYFQAILARHQRTPILGHRIQPHPIRQTKGLAALLRFHPELAEGTWILHSTRHASAIIDGVVYDTFNSTGKVYDLAWSVTPAT